MENQIYIGIARQAALQDQMNITAQNIANSNTPGYRANRVMFESLIERPTGMTSDMAFPAVRQTYRSTEGGVFQQTGNDLDLAIQGDGFFSVQGPGNATYYTRAGNFKLNSANRLVTAQGFPVLSASGSPIDIPEGNKQLKIDDAGNIAGDTGVIGQLDIKEFADAKDMQPVGNTLYKAAGTGQAPVNSKIMQGTVEGSNVQGVYEMTQMIKILRDYQSVQKMLQSEDQRLRDMIGTLSKTQA